MPFRYERRRWAQLFLVVAGAAEPRPLGDLPAALRAA